MKNTSCPHCHKPLGFRQKLKLGFIPGFSKKCPFCWGVISLKRWRLFEILFLVFAMLALVFLSPMVDFRVILAVMLMQSALGFVHWVRCAKIVKR